MRTKGAVAKKKVVEVAGVAKAVVEPVKETIVEIGAFGNEETQKLIAKVNEIIRFINK